jgi:hypothetical protein
MPSVRAHCGSMCLCVECLVFSFMPSFSAIFLWNVCLGYVCACVCGGYGGYGGMGRCFLVMFGHRLSKRSLLDASFFVFWPNVNAGGYRQRWVCVVGGGQMLCLFKPISLLDMGWAGVVWCLLDRGSSSSSMTPCSFVAHCAHAYGVAPVTYLPVCCAVLPSQLCSSRGSSAIRSSACAP